MEENENDDAIQHSGTVAVQAAPDSVLAVFLLFLRLGLTSFGGPVAHLSYFREEFVNRRAWLSERGYADLVSLCQFLPGPASSQVGMALGLIRAGFSGALAAWAGFTLPSAILLTLLASGMSTWHSVVSIGVLHGLKIVAVAVVAQAVWGMARSLCSTPGRICVALLSAGTLLMTPTLMAQLIGLLLAAVVAVLFLSPNRDIAHDPMPVPLTRRTALLLLLVFAGVLIGLPIILRIWPNRMLELFDTFYRTGALVFGGGHVVLPLLQSAVVPNGWVTQDTFLAGYGLAQAIPGPLFAFSAFLGASISGWSGAMVCLVAIFAPGFLLICGALPFWEHLRRSRHTQAALAGVNAAVVGLLLAAFYRPVWTSAILNPLDFGLALLAFISLLFWKLPPWLVVLASIGSGWLLSAVL